MARLNHTYQNNIGSRNERDRAAIDHSFDRITNKALDYENRTANLIRGPRSYQRIRQIVMSYVAKLIDKSIELEDLILRGSAYRQYCQEPGNR